MSHFVGLCFGDWWECNIEPFAEDLQVEEYVVHTKEEAIQIAIMDHNENYEQAVKHINDDSLSEYMHNYYTKITAKGPSLTNEQAWEIVKEWGYKIDENDNLVSSYNPDAKWDWYCTGGRWIDFLYLKETDDTGKRKQTYTAYFDEIDWDYMFEQGHIPFCLVNDDGEWIERGEMGWFGIAINEQDKDEWSKNVIFYIRTLQKELTPEDSLLVTVVDFHI